MIWLEMISTRAAGVIEAEKVLEICRQMQLSVAGEKLFKVAVFCNAKYGTDISIHLYWKSDPGIGSILGKELSFALGDLGLVSHTIWIAQNGLNIPKYVDGRPNLLDRQAKIECKNGNGILVD